MPSIQQLCGQLASADQAEAYRARRALNELTAAAGTPGHDQQRSELAAALARELNRANEPQQEGQARTPVWPPHVRWQVARALAAVAGDMEVPALEQCLGDFDVREMARWALDRANCQAATDALAQAATQAVGIEFRVGAINALARRSGSGVVDALRQCATDADPEVRLAAAEALAEQADPGAPGLDSLIAAACEGAGDSTRAVARTARARIRLAENLLRAGEKEAARQVYQAVLEGPYEEAPKQAAQLGLAQSG